MRRQVLSQILKKTPTKEQWFEGVSFILFNFATSIVFYLLFYRVGAKTAIFTAMIVSCLQWLAHRVFNRPISPYFIVGTVFTVGFGTIDLLIREPWFFRFEPFTQNILMATVFLFTFFSKKSLILWFVQALPKGLRPDVIDEDIKRYFRKVNLIWTIYLYLKAFLFLYLAFTVNLGELFILRTVIGGGTLFLLIVGEFLYRKLFYFNRR